MCAPGAGKPAGLRAASVARLWFSTRCSWIQACHVNQYSDSGALLPCVAQDPVSKVGPGVRYVCVALRQAPHRDSNPDALYRCFMLHRTDGLLVDFSYRKCINKLLRGSWDNKLPRLLELRGLAVNSKPADEVPVPPMSIQGLGPRALSGQVELAVNVRSVGALHIRAAPHPLPT